MNEQLQPAPCSFLDTFAQTGGAIHQLLPLLTLQDTLSLACTSSQLQYVHRAALAVVESVWIRLTPAPVDATPSRDLAAKLRRAVGRLLLRMQALRHLVLETESSEALVTLLQHVQPTTQQLTLRTRSPHIWHVAAAIKPATLTCVQICPPSLFTPRCVSIHLGEDYQLTHLRIEEYGSGAYDDYTFMVHYGRCVFESLDVQSYGRVQSTPWVIRPVTVQSLTLRGHISERLLRSFTGLAELTLLEVAGDRVALPILSSFFQVHTGLRHLAVSLHGPWRTSVHDLRFLRSLQMLTLQTNDEAQWLVPNGCQIRRVEDLTAARMLPQLPEVTEVPPGNFISMHSGVRAPAASATASPSTSATQYTLRQHAQCVLQ